MLFGPAHLSRANVAAFTGERGEEVVNFLSAVIRDVPFTEDPEQFLRVAEEVGRPITGRVEKQAGAIGNFLASGRRAGGAHSTGPIQHGVALAARYAGAPTGLVEQLHRVSVSASPKDARKLAHKLADSGLQPHERVIRIMDTMKRNHKICPIPEVGTDNVDCEKARLPSAAALICTRMTMRLTRPYASIAPARPCHAPHPAPQHPATSRRAREHDVVAPHVGRVGLAPSEGRTAGVTRAVEAGGGGSGD